MAVNAKMNVKNFLLIQILSLIDNLNRTEDIINSPFLQEELRSAVQARFLALIDIQKKELERLHEQLLDGLELEISWNSYLLIYNNCKNIFKESLDFLEGALVRGAGFDENICYIADHLLNEIEKQIDIKWSRLTIIGNNEFFDQTAEIIRLRFPDFGIWRLPIVAHEFGHLVEQELRDFPPHRDVNPIKVMINRLSQNDDKKRADLRELFSDLFGTYTMGPAFACACILLNFNPLKACEETKSHPNFLKRAYFMLKGLEKMSSEEVMDPYRLIIENLHNIWSESILASNQNITINDNTKLELDIWIEDLYSELSKYKAIKYSVSSWRIAVELFAEWNEDLKADRELSTPSCSEKSSLKDVLNAAWLCLIQYSDRDKEIARAAKSLCMAILKRDTKT